jgi:hypothetical protein
MPVCPACQKEQSVAGKLMLSGADSGWVTKFYPDGLRFWTLSRSVSLSDGQLFYACTNCGHVWARLDPKELTSLIQRSKK